MQISAAGSKRPKRQRGFTLLELLVVVSIIAIATAGVAFSLRDSAQTQTEREAQRLAALLESARAQSRTLGVAVVWRATASGFHFDGLPNGSLPEQWLDPATVVAPGSRLELGPDPIVAAQALTLQRNGHSGPTWRVSTDGLRPFRVTLADTTPGTATP